MTTVLGVHQPEPARNILSLKTEVQAVLNQAEGSISTCPCTLPFRARCVDGVSWCPLLEADFVRKCNGPETHADSSCAHRLSFLSPCLVASEFVLTLCPFGLIPAFATVNKAAENVCIQVFV